MNETTESYPYATPDVRALLQIRDLLCSIDSRLARLEVVMLPSQDAGLDILRRHPTAFL